MAMQAPNTAATLQAFETLKEATRWLVVSFFKMLINYFLSATWAP